MASASCLSCSLQLWVFGSKAGFLAVIYFAIGFCNNFEFLSTLKATKTSQNMLFSF